MSWVVWAAILISYDYSTTLLSRAVNGGSLLWHGVWNGIAQALYWARWGFFGQVALEAWFSGRIENAILPGLFFVICSEFGSLLSHWMCMRWFEKGNRKVGANPCAGP